MRNENGGLTQWIFSEWYVKSIFRFFGMSLMVKNGNKKGQTWFFISVLISVLVVFFSTRAACFPHSLACLCWQFWIYVKYLTWSGRGVLFSHIAYKFIVFGCISWQNNKQVHTLLHRTEGSSNLSEK